MRTILRAFLVLLFSAGAGAAANADDGQSTRRKMQKEMLCSAVLVDTEEGTGSGTIISWTQSPDGTSELDVLTNRHNVDELIPKATPKKKKKGTQAAKSKQNKKPERIAPVIVKVYSYENPGLDGVVMREYPATIVAHGTDWDLAILRIKGIVAEKPCVSALAPRGVQPEAGEDSWAVGAPLGYDPLITSGRFGSLDRDVPKQGPRLVSTAPIALGNSGGCLYLLRDRYKCIGVTTILALNDKDKAVPHVNLSITMEAVYEFLEQSGLGHIVEGHQAQ